VPAATTHDFTVRRIEALVGFVEQCQEEQLTPQRHPVAERRGPLVRRPAVLLALY
jgi:hypothetical protein